MRTSVHIRPALRREDVAAFLRRAANPTFLDENLEVGSGSHAVQTAEVMKRFEPVLLRQKPEVVAVVGDVNSTLACALTAVKLGIPVAHVEAGLRSCDRSMPEEINRILTDAISDQLFVTEPSGLANLRAENVPAERIHLVGNVMIDTLIAVPAAHRLNRPRFSTPLSSRPGCYAVLTMHRPANVDRPEDLRGVDALRDCSRLQRCRSRSSWPGVHPRARVRRLRSFQSEPLPNLIFTGAARLSRFHEIDRRRALRADRFRRRARRNHLPWRPLPDDARKHRTPCHGDAGKQSPRRSRSVDKIIAEGLHALVPREALGERALHRSLELVGRPGGRSGFSIC